MAREVIVIHLHPMIARLRGDVAGLIPFNAPCRSLDGWTSTPRTILGAF